MPPKAGIGGHIRLLGILWIANGALYLVPALMILTVFGVAFLPGGLPSFVLSLIPIIGYALLFAGGISAAVGWGLLMHQPWARTGAMIMAAINLLHIPIGTALGIYTLWALLPADREREYKALTRLA
ncbi:MAG: hypothetical protein ABIR70_02710 [Bryobacteraceae bacterium]